MTDFSQCGEQEYILANTPETGRFLDIGSWHPTIFSNVRALFERGWSGLMIEPAPGPFINILRACSQCGDVPSELYGERKAKACEKCGGIRYGDDPRLTLICGAVGFERGLVSIHATDDALSTSDDANFNKWKAIGGFYGSFLAPVITLEDLFNQFGGDFQFVNIDVEGASVDLFKRLLQLGPRPNCIVVEHDSRVVECADAAQAAGYRQVHLNGTNVVYAL